MQVQHISDFDITLTSVTYIHKQATCKQSHSHIPDAAAANALIPAAAPRGGHQSLFPASHKPCCHLCIALMPELMHADIRSDVALPHRAQRLSIFCIARQQLWMPPLEVSKKDMAMRSPGLYYCKDLGNLGRLYIVNEILLERHLLRRGPPITKLPYCTCAASRGDSFKIAPPEDGREAKTMFSQPAFGRRPMTASGRKYSCGILSYSA